MWHPQPSQPHTPYSILLHHDRRPPPTRHYRQSMHHIAPRERLIPMLRTFTTTCSWLVAHRRMERHRHRRLRAMLNAKAEVKSCCHGRWPDPQKRVTSTFVVCPSPDRGGQVWLSLPAVISRGPSCPKSCKTRPQEARQDQVLSCDPGLVRPARIGLYVVCRVRTCATWTLVW